MSAIEWGNDRNDLNRPFSQGRRKLRDRDVRDDTGFFSLGKKRVNLREPGLLVIPDQGTGIEDIEEIRDEASRRLSCTASFERDDLITDDSRRTFSKETPGISSLPSG